MLPLLCLLNRQMRLLDTPNSIICNNLIRRVIFSNRSKMSSFRSGGDSLQDANEPLFVIMPSIPLFISGKSI